MIFSYVNFLTTLIGLKQAVMDVWKELLKAHELMDNGKSRAGLCFYYDWNHDGLTVWFIVSIVIY